MRHPSKTRSRRSARFQVEHPEGRALLAWSSTAAVQSFTLINADTDQPVASFSTLNDGATIDLPALPTRDLNIQANTNTTDIGSVQFGYDGNPSAKVETSAPYAL